MPWTQAQRPRLYRIWNNIRSRCNNPNSPRFADYGGRGITVKFTDYRDFTSWAKANGYADGLTIERKDNDGDYSRANCAWIERAAQARNKRNNRWLTLNGESKTVAEWSETQQLGATLRNRLHRGWNSERALTEPRKAIAKPQKRQLTYQGQTMSLYAWAKRLGLKPAAIYARANRGLPTEQILAPVKQVAPYGSRKTFTPLAESIPQR